jgi:hypothetical protein
VTLRNVTWCYHSKFRRRGPQRQWLGSEVPTKGGTRRGETLIRHTFAEALKNRHEDEDDD